MINLHNTALKYSILYKKIADFFPQYLHFYYHLKKIQFRF